MPQARPSCVIRHDILRAICGSARPKLELRVQLSMVLRERDSRRNGVERIIALGVGASDYSRAVRSARPHPLSRSTRLLPELRARRWA